MFFLIYVLFMIVDCMYMINEHTNGIIYNTFDTCETFETRFTHTLFIKPCKATSGINMKDQHSTAIAFKTMKRKKEKISHIQFVESTYRLILFIAIEQWSDSIFFVGWDHKRILSQRNVSMTGTKFFGERWYLKLIHPNCNWAN